MADTVFKSQSETVDQPEQNIVAAPETSTGNMSNVEVPYLDYESTHAGPFLADYFKLGDSWNDPVGGFPKEIEEMQSFIEEKIKYGEIANSQTAVKDLLKGMEKMNNLSKEERAVVKIGVLRNYMEFVRKNDNVRRNTRIYASS